jgi:hypothetical protein
MLFETCFEATFCLAYIHSIQHIQTCSPEDQGQPRPHHISGPTNPDQRSSKTEWTRRLWKFLYFSSKEVRRKSDERCCWKNHFTTFWSGSMMWASHEKIVFSLKENFLEDGSLAVEINWIIKLAKQTNRIL